MCLLTFLKRVIPPHLMGIASAFVVELQRISRSIHPTDYECRMLMSRSFLCVAVVVAMTLGLAGCSKVIPYRYKLTLAVNTPDGVKRGSSVVEVAFYQVWFPERGTMHKLRGEALYLDLGPGARPLIALLTRQLPKGGSGQHWTRDAGPETRWMSQIYGQARSEDFIDDVPRLARLRGPRPITPADLPDLVTFADANDPNSVIEVDPNDLQATLGPNITWNEITLESTDEAITKGIELKLPWIVAYWCGMLDGDRYHGKTTVANTLSTADFQDTDESRDRIRKKLRGDIILECWKSKTEWQQRHR
jgi:hypothetical protein